MGFCIESTSTWLGWSTTTATRLAADDEYDHHFRCNDHEKLMNFMRYIVFGKHEMIWKCVENEVSSRLDRLWSDVECINWCKQCAAYSDRHNSSLTEGDHQAELSSFVMFQSLAASSTRCAIYIYSRGIISIVEHDWSSRSQNFKFHIISRRSMMAWSQFRVRAAFVLIMMMMPIDLRREN